MSSEGNEAPHLVSVMNGDICVGFLIGLGSHGVEAFDASEKSLGTFLDARSAATAVEKSVASMFRVCSMNRRQRLPNRRAAETFEIEISGLRYTATAGRFADGRIGELFL